MKGPDCAECLQLANAASHAVDFPKTGTPANFKDIPRQPGPEKPDFLAPESADASDTSRYYPSPKLLGILYRSVPTEVPPPPLNPGTSPSGGDIIIDALQQTISNLDLSSLETPPDDLMEEMESLLNYHTEKLLAIAYTHAVSKNHEARLSEGELISGTIKSKWVDHRKRREGIISMNLQVRKRIINYKHATYNLRYIQTYELARIIRDDLKRTWVDQDIEETQSDDEDYDSDDDEMDQARKAAVFERAWAAWLVSEEALIDYSKAFGPQSFGLIALGVLLEVVKDARDDRMELGYI